MALDFVSTLPPEILLKARDELGEDDQRIADGILAIKEWAKKQPHLQAMPTGNTIFKCHDDYYKSCY